MCLYGEAVYSKGGEMRLLTAHCGDVVAVLKQMGEGRRVSAKG